MQQSWCTVVNYTQIFLRGWVSVLQRRKVTNSIFSWPSNWQEPQGVNISENCGTTGWDQRLNKLVCLPITCVNSAGLNQKPAMSENPKTAQARRDTDLVQHFMGQRAWTAHSHEERKWWLSFRMFGHWNIRLSYYCDFFFPLETRNLKDFSKTFSRYTQKINSHWTTMTLYIYK